MVGFLYQFNCLTFHVVIDINVALSGSNVGMAHKACQQPHTDTFISQCCDEGAPTTVTATTCNARSFVEVVEMLSHGIC